MRFVEDIATLCKQVREISEYVFGEEQTKLSLILPFIKALGYDIHNPKEVITEYTADFARRRSGRFEQVDYALFIDKKPVMFVEAKARTARPEDHDGQLRRYFNASVPTKVAFVTNGLIYRFFTDSCHLNIMDEQPFFTFEILAHKVIDVRKLELFQRQKFNAEFIMSNISIFKS